MVLYLPVILENQISAETGVETRFVLGSNFPESQGPPAALQLTAPLGPSELHEPSQGVLVPGTFKEIFFRPPLTLLGFETRNTTWIF